MMNPLYPSDDPFFQISFLNPPLSIQSIPEDQILHDSEKDGSCLPYKSKVRKGKQQKQFPASGKQECDENITKDENKRWIHREIERQRRQEMANLCASLRSLLPLEYIKGKRSTSDHMYEAVNYIKHLQNKVKQLQARRDELKKLPNLSLVGTESGTFTTDLPISVIVHPYSGGAEIMCSYSFRKYVFTLSRVLNVLLNQGLNVVSCTFTKTDESFIHTIRIEDSNMSETDYSELQRKLTEAIILSTSSSAQTVSEHENC